MPDKFDGMPETLESPPSRAYDVVPNDSVDLAQTTRAIYVGTPGNVRVTTDGGDTVTYVGVAGRLSGRFTRIFATDTTAVDIIGEY